MFFAVSYLPFSHILQCWLVFLEQTPKGGVRDVAYMNYSIDTQGKRRIVVDTYRHAPSDINSRAIYVKSCPARKERGNRLEER
jgi:hypothetical protein